MSDIDFQSVVAKADLCRLLSACYYEPGPEFVEERLFDALLTAAESLDPALAAQAVQLKRSFEGERIDTLLVDYAKLFLGPGHTLAPPYESAWRDKNSDDPMESVRALIELYDDGGFVVDPDFRDLPDHLAVELEFLYTLFFREAAARQNGDAKAQAHAQALQWSLQTRHIDAWLGAFVDALRQNAQCSFYRDLAAMTVAFMRKAGEDLRARQSSAVLS